VVGPFSTPTARAAAPAVSTAAPNQVAATPAQAAPVPTQAASAPTDEASKARSARLAELDEKIRAKQAEVDAKETVFKSHQAQLEKDLIDIESRRSEMLLGKIYDAIREVARESGISVVVDKSQILFGQNSVDLTDKVVKKLQEIAS